MNQENTELEVHEFYLKSEYGMEENKRITRIYRVALGQLIEARERETFNTTKNPRHYDNWNQSGSIGYMDVEVSEQKIPKEGHEKDYPLDCEKRLSLEIRDIAIEPQYRRKGYAKFLKQKAEELALKWGLDVIVSPWVTNPIIKELNVKLGYKMYDKERKFVKRLK